MAKKKIHVEYDLDKELSAEFDDILSSKPQFIPLKDKLKFAACFLIRMDEHGESQPGKGKRVAIKKVSPDFQVFMKAMPHFVLVVDKHWWNDVKESERRGTVIKMLTRIRLEDTDDGVKTGLNGWDIEETFASLKLNGVYNDDTRNIMEWCKSVDRSLEMAAGGIARMNSEAPAAEPDEPEDPPRVVARAVTPKRKSAPAAEEAEAPERTRPPRRIPADPEPSPASPEDPEPED